jgi:hypothetical protein
LDVPGRVRFAGAAAGPSGPAEPAVAPEPAERVEEGKGGALESETPVVSREIMDAIRKLDRVLNDRFDRVEATLRAHDRRLRRIEHATRGNDPR